MASGSDGQATKRDRQRVKAEARREAERKARQQRNLAYGLGGVALIAIVVMFVVALMGGNDGGGTQPSTQGDVTVRGTPQDTPLADGTAVPEFTAPDLSGGTVAWSDYAGAPAVLSLWAPWCSHCQVELPVLDRVMKDYPGVGWVTIVTAIDPETGPDPVEFMAEHNLDFPAAVDDEQGTLSSAFGLEVFPTIFFVSSDGTVATHLTGEVDEATLRATIESLS